MFDEWFVGEDGCYYYGDGIEEIREENRLGENFKKVKSRNPLGL